MAVSFIKPAISSPYEGRRAADIQGVPAQKNRLRDHYESSDCAQIAKVLLGIAAPSLGILATLGLCRGGVVPPRFLSAVKWSVTPGRFHGPTTLRGTELLTAFRRGEDGVCRIEKLLTGCHSEMLSSEPLAGSITEASAYRFTYKARAETIRFLPRADGSISLSFVDTVGEGGEVVFGAGTPWHRFLTDNQTLWEGKPAGRDHSWLAERLAMLMTAEDSESFAALQGTGALSFNSSVRGVTGHPVSAVTRLARRGRGRVPTYSMREVDRNGGRWQTEINLARSYLSSPVPGWWKVSFGHRPSGTDSFLNGSILVREDSCSGRVLEGFRRDWIKTDQEEIFEIPRERFEAFLQAVPLDRP